MLTQEQKLDFIKSQNIKYKYSTNVSLDDVYKFAIVKELVKDRLHEAPECFGTIDTESSVCKSCFLNTNGTCQKLKDYMTSSAVSKVDDQIKVGVVTNAGEVFKMQDLNLVLEKINLRESSLSYKIAKAILESNECTYQDIIQKIMGICGPSTKIEYAKTRFYQVRKAIEEKTDLKIEILIKKYVHIMKDTSK